MYDRFYKIHEIFNEISKNGVEINNRKFFIPDNNSQMSQIYNFSNPTLK